MNITRLSRPRYETEKTKEDEIRVKNLIESKWKNCKVHLHPPQYFADYSIFINNKFYAFGEYKKREHPQSKFPNYYISTTKLAELYEISKITDSKAILFVEWEKDGIWFVNINDIDIKVDAINGRNGRDDPYDKEPITYIDYSKFKRLII